MVNISPRETLVQGPEKAPTLASLLAERRREEGRWHSSGRFTLGLEDAHFKLARYGQDDPNLWTLKLVQCFAALECSSLTVEVLRSTWRLTGRGSSRGIDLDGFWDCYSERPLSSRNFAENYLAAALIGLGMWPIEAVAYSLNRQPLVSDLRCRNQNQLPSNEGGHLVLEFQFNGPMPRFPVALWSRNLTFCSTTVLLGNKILNRPGSGEFFRSKRKPCRRDGPFWLESVQLGETGFHINPSGWAESEIGLPLNPLLGHFLRAPSTRLRWTEGALDGRRASSLLIVRPLLKDESLFHPVAAGIALEPFALPGFPFGLDIVFDADDLGTDLSQLKLRQGFELDSRVVRLVKAARESAELLLLRHDHFARVTRSQRPRRNPLADLLAFISACVVWAIAMRNYDNHPALCLYIALVGTLPALNYFWTMPSVQRREVSKSQSALRLSLAELVADLDSYSSR